MAVIHVPLLQIQRDLYDLPLGRERFLRYLAVMTGAQGDLVYPFPNFNPMGKAHVAETLDTLLAIDAESIAAAAVEEAANRLDCEWPDAKVGLVVVDDRGGGWTNRHFLEIARRLNPGALLKWGWLDVVLWTGDHQDADRVRSAVLTTLFRVSEHLRSGPPRTLGDLLRRESRSARFVGTTAAILEPEDLAYSREIVLRYLDAPADDPTVVLPCLFGDDAARSVGYSPLGLSSMAGIAVARAEDRGEDKPFEALVNASSRG